MADEARTIPVLLVDDHTVVRQGLRMVMSLEDDLEVVGEAANGREAVEAVAELSPQVVLMDLLMPVMNGVEAIRAIKAQHPEVEVVALTSVLRPAAKTSNCHTSLRRSIAESNAKWRSNQAPSTASRVLPTAMPSAGSAGEPTAKFAMNAATAMPGQTR